MEGSSIVLEPNIWVLCFHWEGNGNPLHYSCLAHPMDRGASWTTVHGVSKSQTSMSTHTSSYITTVQFLHLVPAVSTRLSHCKRSFSPFVISKKSVKWYFGFPFPSLLCFLPLKWYHLHIWGCWYFSWQSWCQLVLHPAWHFSWCTLHISKISRVTKYSLDILLSQF